MAKGMNSVVFAPYEKTVSPNGSTQDAAGIAIADQKHDMK